MDDETRPEDVAPAIVGGPPRRPGRRHQPQGKLEIPVGLERILVLAARDPGFRERLLADRRAAIGELGVALRSSERAVLAAAPRAALAAMIDRIEPANPRKRRLMNLVAAAATSLAAGTAGAGCDWVDDPTMNYADGGVGPDTDVETDTGADAGVPTAAGQGIAWEDPGTGVDAGVGPDLDAGAWNASENGDGE